MRLVLDTNVLIAGLLWHGPPRQLIDHILAGNCTAFTCLQLQTELYEVLSRPKFSHRLTIVGKDTMRIVGQFARLARWMPVPDIVPRICRDPADDFILECARMANADALVSGDLDLLVLGKHHNVRILRPAEVVRALAHAYP